MPVNVNPALRFARYAALVVGVGYGYRRYENLKPIAAQEREVEAQKAKDKAELEAVRKAEAAKIPILG